MSSSLELHLATGTYLIIYC